MPPRNRSWMTLAALIYGLAFAIWIGYEDRSSGPVTALGAGGAALLVIHTIAGMRSQFENASTMRRLAALSLAGAAAGLLVAPLTATLMALKVSLHSHPAPDFTAEALVGTLARTPVWAVAGLLTGAGAGMVGAAFGRPPPKGN